MAKEETISRPVEQLRENGPATSAELSYAPDIHKENIRRLHFGGDTTAVYYLNSAHSEVEVLREYINVNERVLSENDRTSLTLMFRQAGPAFRVAWEKIVDEYDLRKRNTESPPEKPLRDCPYCDSKVKNIPMHLRHKCPEM